MINFFIDLLQIAIIIRLGYGLIRFIYRSKHSKKSLSYKVYKLFHNKMSYKIDRMLDAQKDRLQKARDNKVVLLKNTAEK